MLHYTTPHYTAFHHATVHYAQLHYTTLNYNNYNDNYNYNQNCNTLHTSSTAQGGGGRFKNRKPIGEVGCCESEMAERSH